MRPLNTLQCIRSSSTKFFWNGNDGSQAQLYFVCTINDEVGYSWKYHRKSNSCYWKGYKKLLSGLWSKIENLRSNCLRLGLLHWIQSLQVDKSEKEEEGKGTEGCWHRQNTRLQMLQMLNYLLNSQTMLRLKRCDTDWWRCQLKNWWCCSCYCWALVKIRRSTPGPLCDSRVCCNFGTAVSSYSRSNQEKVDISSDCGILIGICTNGTHQLRRLLI